MVGLILEPRRKRQIDQVFEVAVIVAAVATMPLTYAHMQEWDGPILFVMDWVVWGVFAAEFAFSLLVSPNRWRTTKRQPLNVAIVIVSFPLLPHLLGLTRLLRLIRPLRLMGGLRIARPLALARMWALRSVGSKRAMGKAKQTKPGQLAQSKLEDARKEAGSKVPGVGRDSD